MGHPRSGRVGRDARKMHRAGAELDEEQDVEPTEDTVSMGRKSQVTIVVAWAVRNSFGTVASADGGLGQAVLMRRRHSRLPVPRSSFAGFRFPPEVIPVAVRWYLRYGLSYRDIEELLAERGIEVDHVTVYRWVQRFTPWLIDAARPCRHVPGDRWFADETSWESQGVAA